jgi:outer membrane protein assembly factor BamB
MIKKIFKILLVSSVILLIPTIGFAQPAAQVNSTTKKGNPLAHEFKFSISGNRYSVKDEKFYIDSNNKSVSLTNDGNIEQLYYFPFKGDVVLVYGISSGGEGWGKIARIAVSSGKIKWQAHIPTFNIGQPLQEQQTVYMSGTGFVSKLNLETGKYLWERQFYNKYSIDAFGLPVVKGNQVLFRELSSVAINNKPRTLVVDKNNGNIIRLINR